MGGSGGGRELSAEPKKGSERSQTPTYVPLQPTYVQDGQRIFGRINEILNLAIPGAGKRDKEGGDYSDWTETADRNSADASNSGANPRIRQPTFQQRPSFFHPPTGQPSPMSLRMNLPLMSWYSQHREERMRQWVDQMRIYGDTMRSVLEMNQKVPSVQMPRFVDDRRGLEDLVGRAVTDREWHKCRKRLACGLRQKDQVTEIKQMTQLAEQRQESDTKNNERDEREEGVDGVEEVVVMGTEEDQQPSKKQKHGIKQANQMPGDTNESSKSMSTRTRRRSNSLTLPTKR